MAAAKATKKAESKAKVSDKVKAKVTSTNPKKDAPKEAPKPNKVPESTRKSRSTDSDVEAAVAEAMEEVDAHEYASSEVSQSETVEFYKGIITECRDRISTIEGEMGEADEDEDAAPADDQSDEPLDLGDNDGEID